jgi:hypothetical protein
MPRRIEGSPFKARKSARLRGGCERRPGRRDTPVADWRGLRRSTVCRCDLSLAIPRAKRSAASRLRRRASMARLRMMPRSGRAVSTNSCRHRRRNGLPNETFAKDRCKSLQRANGRAKSPAPTLAGCPGPSPTRLWTRTRSHASMAGQHEPTRCPANRMVA